MSTKVSAPNTPFSTETVDEIMGELPVNQTFWATKDKEAEEQANIGQELMEVQGIAEKVAEITEQADLEADDILDNAGQSA